MFSHVAERVSLRGALSLKIERPSKRNSTIKSGDDFLPSSALSHLVPLGLVSYTSTAFSSSVAREEESVEGAGVPSVVGACAHARGAHKESVIVLSKGVFMLTLYR